MKKLLSVLIVCFFATTAFAAVPASEPAGATSQVTKAKTTKKPLKHKSVKKKHMKKISSK